MKKMMLLMVTLLASGGLFAASDVAKLAEKYEKTIQQQIKLEKIPLRRLQREFLYRQSYNNDLVRQRDILIRSGTLSTPKVEALRKEREALIEQLKALDQKITEASAEAPELIELQAILEANNNRIEELRQSIMPETAPATQPDAEP
jgi:chromosome segregation ATPase